MPAGRSRIEACLILAAIACVAGCSAPAPDDRDHGPLFDRIREYRADYERGLETILAGDPITGENLLAAASKRLSVAAQECARTVGCDEGLFADAMAELTSSRARDRDTAWIANLDPYNNAAPATRSRPVAVPEAKKTAAMLLGTDLRELIPMNRQVKAALDRWLTWQRRDLLEAWENYQYLRAEMAPIYDDAGFPEALLFAMLAKETGAKVHAYSRAGAAGPLQFMPRTAMRYGLRTVDGYDLRLDPVASTRANVAYLNDQFRALNDDLEKTLAAYNSGESRVRRLHRNNDGAAFWDPRIYDVLPRETRQYVPMILAAAILFLHPEEYGLELPPIEASTISVRLESAISISELTVCLGQVGNPWGWYRTLRNLNPRLRPGERVPPGGAIEMPSKVVSAYAERCVGNSTWLQLARELHDAEHAKPPQPTHYTVLRGDSLAEIASRLRVSLGALASLNDLEPPRYVIRPGQRLSVPKS
jgi:membrane-bound lytic murein transglycosylase D